MPSQPKVVVGLCCLGQYKKATVESLIELTHSPIIEGWCAPESALLPIARNRVIQAAYLRSPDFTHLLCIDDDMSHFHAMHVQKLLSDDVDIVSAFVTFRKPPYHIVGAFLDGIRPEDILRYSEEQSLQEVSHCGMAFTLIKREVLDKLEEQVVDTGPHVEPGSIWFTTDRNERINFDYEVSRFIESKKKEGITEESLRQAILMGQYSHLGTPITGEDISFCRTAKRFGFKIYVDCGCPVGHVGDYAYDFRMALMDGAEKCQQTQNN